MKQKSENQKAFPRFLGILVVASLIGGVLGGLSGVAGYFWKDHTAFGAAFAHLLGAASPLGYGCLCRRAAGSWTVPVPQVRHCLPWLGRRG